MENTIFENMKWKSTHYGSTLALYSSQKDMCFKNPPILIVGGVHGDEPEGVWLCEKLLEYIKSVSLPSHTDWILIPCLNPDGYCKNQRTNGNGVDLNRNFPSQDWSPAFKDPRYFPGKHPKSELETQALIELIEASKPRLIIHCHSWKPAIIYTCDTIPPEAKLLADVSGYALQPDIGYPTPGSLGQYGYFEHKIPVICIEEREGATAIETWNRFQKAFHQILFGINL
jgi:hypothetical protein